MRHATEARVTRVNERNRVKSEARRPKDQGISPAFDASLPTAESAI